MEASGFGLTRGAAQVAEVPILTRLQCRRDLGGKIAGLVRAGERAARSGAGLVLVERFGLEREELEDIWAGFD